MGMRKKEKLICNMIIHTACLLSAGVGAGLAKAPCSDSLIITPIQLSMTISLGKVFGLRLDESAARSAIASASAATVGRAASQVATGWIPIAGEIINASTAAVLTETIGWILAVEFSKQRIESLG